MESPAPLYKYTTFSTQEQIVLKFLFQDFCLRRTINLLFRKMVTQSNKKNCPEQSKLVLYRYLPPAMPA